MSPIGKAFTDESPGCNLLGHHHLHKYYSGGELKKECLVLDPSGICR
jgi:hypothetical protein